MNLNDRRVEIPDLKTPHRRDNSSSLMAPGSETADRRSRAVHLCSSDRAQAVRGITHLTRANASTSGDRLSRYFSRIRCSNWALWLLLPCCIASETAANNNRFRSSCTLDTAASADCTRRILGSMRWRCGCRSRTFNLVTTPKRKAISEILRQCMLLPIWRHQIKCLFRGVEIGEIQVALDDLSGID